MVVVAVRVAGKVDVGGTAVGGTAVVGTVVAAVVAVGGSVGVTGVTVGVSVGTNASAGTVKKLLRTCDNSTGIVLSLSSSRSFLRSDD